MKLLALDPGTLQNNSTPNRRFKLYIHTCPNNKIYIGITCLSLSNRWRRGNGYKNSILFNRAIKKYGWENIKHEILYTNLTKKEAEKVEIKLIKERKSNNKKFGYNIENGGQFGAIGVKRSNETLIKMSLANKGKKMSEATKLKISKTLKGRVFTKEHSAKKSLAQTGDKNHRFGKKASKETRAKMSQSQKKGKDNILSKKVIQYSIETKKQIKIWDSMSDIRMALGFNHCGISHNCRGIQKTAYGFIWKYYNQQTL